MNITQVKDILGRKFRGSSLDDVQGITNYSIFEEAASNLLSGLDPQETVRRGELNLYDQVYDYGLTTTAPDLKGKKIIDLRPQANRDPSDDFRQTFIEDFDRDKDFEDNWFSVEFDEATKFLRVDKTVGNSIAITDLESGNYTAGTGVSNITEDTIIHFGQSKSIEFDVSSGSNLLTWSGTAADLTSHELKSSWFLPIYLPDSSIISSVTVRVGSSASDYYEVTGAIHFGSIRDGHNLYRFDWDGATETGTFDEDSVDYVRLSITTTGADTDIRIGLLESKLPTPYEAVYYSNAVFRSSAGTWLTKPTADTDDVVLESEAQNIFIYECCVLIAEGLQYEAEAQKFYTHLHGDAQKPGLYDEYMRDKPAEAIRPQSYYYRVPNRNRSGGYRDWKPTKN